MAARSEKPVDPRRPVAPWVRTRLRTAPGAAAALGVLVLFTAFLAAGFPGPSTRTRPGDCGTTSPLPRRRAACWN